jgi:hypothetical protein
MNIFLHGCARYYQINLCCYMQYACLHDMLQQHSRMHDRHLARDGS